MTANDLQMLVDEKVSQFMVWPEKRISELFGSFQVDDHKKLRGGVHFVEKIPRNPQGKILRKNLASLLG